MFQFLIIPLHYKNILKPYKKYAKCLANIVYKYFIRLLTRQVYTVLGTYKVSIFKFEHILLTVYMS